MEGAEKAGRALREVIGPRCLRPEQDSTAGRSSQGDSRGSRRSREVEEHAARVEETKPYVADPQRASHSGSI